MAKIWQFANGVSGRVDDDPYVLRLFDTSDSEEYPPLKLLTYLDTDVFLDFACIGIEDSFRHVEETWVPEIKQNCPGVPFIIVGISGIANEAILAPLKSSGKKMALQTHRDYMEAGEDMAKRLGAAKYIDCNISTQEHLKNVFSEVSVPPRRSVCGFSWIPSESDPNTKGLNLRPRPSSQPFPPKSWTTSSPSNRRLRRSAK